MLWPFPTNLHNIHIIYYVLYTIYYTLLGDGGIL